MTPNNPHWWNDTHNSAWDRVKEALRRDWEQTRNDLSGGRDGHDLNQQVGDTIAQAAGKAPIPPRDVANPLTGAQLEAKVEKAQQAQRAAERAYARGAEKVAEEFSRRWNDAEAPIRYGYGAATHYGYSWNPETERRVREEASRLYPETRWEDIREDVRFAWDRAARAIEAK